MRLRSPAVAMLWHALVVLLALGAVADAKDKAPRVKKTVLDFLITDLQYFENSDTIIAHSTRDGTMRISTDGGEEWKEPKGIGREQIRRVYLNPNDDKRAYAVGAGYRHYYTKDQGKSWDHFDLEISEAMIPTDSPMPFNFHAGDPDKVIVNAHSRPCLGLFCEFKSYYTTDGFKSVKELRRDSRSCIWARATSNLVKSVADKDDNLVLCIVEENELSLFQDGTRILKSDDFFKTEMTPKLDGRNEIKGILEIIAVRGYLLAAQKSQGTAELRLYVSDDAEQWDRAEFPKKIEQEAYTVLESTDYSVQVHVMTGSSSSLGSILSSNSNGTYFTENIEHVNRNEWGNVDFEKVQGIQGIYLVNTVDNWEDVEHHQEVPKKLVSQITFDDGRTFHNLRVVDEDGKETKDVLHLHSVTGMSNSGRIFSSPAPGLVLGVGNTGNYLNKYNEGDLWVSDDAGLTWRHALKEAHKYEFGDQGSVLIAINDEESTKEVSYSLTHGRKWEKFELEDKIRAVALTTTPDSTGLKFLLVGTEGGGSETRFVVYAIDFEGLHEGECGSDDFETWTARKDDEGNPDCLMGHTQTYRRRKPEKECFINEEFKEPQMTTQDCTCTSEDFECEYNFVKTESGDCVPTESFKPAGDQCTSSEEGEKFEAAAYRLIPGNTCSRKDGKNLDDDKKEFACGDTKSTRPANGEISVKSKEFSGLGFQQKVYLERSATSSGEDETVLVRNDMNEVYMSRDQGKTWTAIDEFGKDQITMIIPHQYNQDTVFFLTNTKRVYYSTNRGKTFHSFEARSAPVGPRSDVPPLSFHVSKHNWLIWTGGVDCDINTGSRCHYDAHYSKDGGETWQSLLHYCRRCEFIKAENWRSQDELIYCEQYTDEDPNGALELVSSDDWFGSSPKEHFKDIVAFATMSGFIVVANKDSESNLKIDASVDGQTFADAQFPKNFNVPHRTAYTLLDSSTRSIFLEVTVSTRQGFEYGQLMKSNSNGTSYVSLINGVNQNGYGYVDFEKMFGLTGTALVNTVSNWEDEKAPSKLLQTKITHNDGAAWSLIHQVEDQTGDKFECDPKKGSDDCALHLHGYTERDDPRDTFSSPSAVGLMMGVGNVGQYLQGEDQTDTFLTRDGGISWKRVRRGKYMWEYGDQGSLLVIVQDKGSTNKVFYTLNEGKDWKEYVFAEEPVTVTDLTTVPSDSSSSFIVWGTTTSKRKLVAINIDFTGLRGRTCKLEHKDDKSLDEGDYELWSPKHPMQDTDCLFGHKTMLHRKKPDADCWNDKTVTLDPVHSEILTNCTCTRQDFECDYNYALSADNNCMHVPGTEEIDPMQQCKDNSDLKFYHETKGFRKIPMSTCQGGEEGPFWGQELPCPGFEKEFERTHGGLSGFGLFVVAIFLPFAAASSIGYWVYKNWDGKFGRIRLGESQSSNLDANQPWIKYPVAVFSAIVAVVAAVPLLLSAAWHQVSSRVFGGGSRYTTRESFARGRATYAVVDQDEDELLGGEEDDF